MFVRFRRRANRLQASLIETHRVGGKIVAEHIGALGSVDTAVSVRGRFAFWAKLPRRLTSLGNRAPRKRETLCRSQRPHPNGHVRSATRHPIGER
jgi:hypothetical protein